MKFSLSEIQNWKEFEDLLTDYFRAIKEAKENNLMEVFVEPSGEGTDGGRDILLTFRINDSIVPFTRRWVVQCKFYKESVSKRHIATVNIPSLIHEYNADGYLLVCKNGVTSSVSNMFENFRRTCKLDYSYMIWEGNDLINKLKVMPDLIEKFFPEYSSYLEEKANRIKV